MIAAFFGDEAARELDDVAPHHRRHQRSGVQRLREKSQAAEGVIDTGEVFFQMAADFRRRIQTRQHVDETKQARRAATRLPATTRSCGPADPWLSKSVGLCSAAF